MKILSILILLVIISQVDLSSQEIEANVTVNIDQLSQESRVNVQTMKYDLEKYINNQRFTNLDWEGPRIPVEISIFLSGGYNNRYGAKLLIISKRYLDGPEEGASVALRLVDEKWAFDYSRYANLTFNPLRFHEFSSLIDYYMLLIIGMDLDTYGELEGTRTYEKAKQICQLGASNNADGYGTYSTPGEFTRYSLVNEFTDLRYEDLRKLIFAYYVDGLDEMGFDKDKGLASLEAVIDDMVKFKRDKMVGPSLVLQAFLDAKYLEFIGMFKEYHNKDIFKKLMYLDPSNTNMYDDAMNE